MFGASWFLHPTFCRPCSLIRFPLSTFEYIFYVLFSTIYPLRSTLFSFRLVIESVHFARCSMFNDM